jgi:16S rRNA (cytosine967-C5)-methyltransferase
MTVSPARRSAFEILRRVEAEAAFASVLLAALDTNMREDDRALSHELVLGVLRRRLWLDRSLEHFANRSIAGFDLAVRLALELGLYQLRFLSRIPPSAAVNESVNLVRAARLKSAASFVNAVLRRATREPDYDPSAAVNDPIERLSIETSHPRWLIDRWANAFGFREAADLARANNQPAPVAFRLTVKSQDNKERILSEWAAAGAEVFPSKVAPDSWRVIGAGRAAQELAREGLIYFQDEASQLVAHLLSAGDSDRIVDLAAAPGSKATQISMLAPGATIVAGDFYPHRIVTTRGLANTQRAQLHFLVHDATQRLPFADSSFDRVLLDAPCSGTGTLRRNPEIRWRLQPGDIEELSLQQLAMLANAAKVVRPQGRVVYSTCSVEIEENERVVQRFLADNNDFVRVELNGPRELRTPNGDIRTWPHRQDVDGFFIAALTRKG